MVDEISQGIITHRTYARAGLFGNPSDQYGGRTIAFSLTNFYAEVTLTPSAGSDEHGSGTIRIQPHPVCDSTEYASLSDLVRRTSSEGLYGGLRLLTAACKRFAEHCAQHEIPLLDPGQRSSGVDEADRGEDSAAEGSRLTTVRPSGFTLSYDTTVPRQTGMAGSSAIIYSTIKCLMDWYGLGEDAVPYSVRPGLVLSVEAAELGIAAGLQDRVVQVYGGVVHMDFDMEYMAANGGVGRYGRLDSDLLPKPLYIMYSQNPSESGKVHSGVKAKWVAGDPEVRALMTRVARCGDEGLRLLTLPPGRVAPAADEVPAPPDCPDPAGMDRDRQLAALMNENFDLRHALFGDQVLGAHNLRMVELVRSVGAGVNFTGSGGAVVVFCPGGEPQAKALRAAAEAEGFTLVPAEVGPVQAPLPLPVSLRPPAGH